jgi:hypothetical protein
MSRGNSREFLLELLRKKAPYHFNLYQSGKHKSVFAACVAAGLRKRPDAKATAKRAMRAIRRLPYRQQVALFAEFFAVNDIRDAITAKMKANQRGEVDPSPDRIRELTARVLAGQPAADSQHQAGKKR